MNAIESIPVSVEGPELTISPIPVVLDGHLLDGERKIGTSDPDAGVTDPVLRNGLQAVEHQQYPHLRFRQRLGARIGQLNGPTCAADAVVRPRVDHCGDVGQADQIRSQYRVEISDGVR